MWPVFKYTFKRALFKTSTYLIFGISVGLSALILMALNGEEMNGLTLAYIYYGGIFMMLIFALLIPIFTAAKANVPIRLELDEGTFLTVISKPISRTKIVIAKWLAFVATLAVYLFALMFTIMLILMLFNKEVVMNGVVVGKAASTGMLINISIRAYIFTLASYIGVGTILLILSLKVGTKLLTAIGLIFGIAYLAVPGILGVIGVANMTNAGVQPLECIDEEANWTHVNGGEATFNYTHDGGTDMVSFNIHYNMPVEEFDVWKYEEIQYWAHGHTNINITSVDGLTGYREQLLEIGMDRCEINFNRYTALMKNNDNTSDAYTGFIKYIDFTYHFSNMSQDFISLPLIEELNKETSNQGYDIDAVKSTFVDVNLSTEDGKYYVDSVEELLDPKVMYIQYFVLLGLIIAGGLRYLRKKDFS